ncbi:MAG: anaerobic ribonucleoside-triphosphate reductase activating protein [Candidatus Auribacterota bacterium]|nr:anaerobic ribonucleoside-triphosphate reductase activating protein [Candidatus Auribacterota bacterium]
MNIVELQKFSLIEYPGKVSCIIFTQGCNFECCYCHNPELIKSKPVTNPKHTMKDIINFLKARKDQLEGIVITGGEPFIQSDLEDFCRFIKEETSISVKINTNGSAPGKLKRLIDAKLVDYISLDVKAPAEKYPTITGTWCPASTIYESVVALKLSTIPHMFHITMARPYIGLAEVKKIISEFKLPLDRVKLQKCVPDRVLDSSKMPGNQYNDADMERMNVRLGIRKEQYEQK